MLNSAGDPSPREFGPFQTWSTQNAQQAFEAQDSMRREGMKNTRLLHWPAQQLMKNSGMPKGKVPQQDLRPLSRALIVICRREKATAQVLL